MANKHGFVAAGCWTLDRIKNIDHWPTEETLATIDSFELQGGGSGHNTGVDPTSIVGTNGAGDAFAAGMLYGLHEHWSIERSMQLAHATAAASLRSATTVGFVGSVGSVTENLSQL